MISVRYLLLTAMTGWYAYTCCGQQPLPRLSFDRLSDSSYMDSLTTVTRQYHRKLQNLPTTAKNDTLRFKTLFYLGRLYQWRKDHRDSASYFGGELVRQAQRNKNVIFEIAGKYLLAATCQADESRIQEALRLNLEILPLTFLSNQPFLNLIDVRTNINLGELYAKLRDSVNSVRFLQEARKRIGYLKEATSPSSTTGKIVEAIFEKLFGSINYYVNAETINIFVTDIDRRLTISRQQTQQPSNSGTERWTNKRATFAQDQSVYDELILDRYQQGERLRSVSINSLYTLLGLLLCTITLIVYAGRLRKRRAEANRLLVQERQEANVRLIQTQEAERHRLARDLHDGVGVELAVLRMLLSTLTDDEASNITLTASVDDLDRISREVREIAHALTPAELGLGFVNSLQQLIDRLVAVYPQIEINFMAAVNHPIIPATEQAVYAMAKELLNNALKHANASVIDVELYTQDHRLWLRVGDNGQGCDPQICESSSGIGLRNLRKTTKELSGGFTIVRKPESGIISEVWVEA